MDKTLWRTEVVAAELLVAETEAWLARQRVPRRYEYPVTYNLTAHRRTWMPRAEASEASFEALGGSFLVPHSRIMGAGGARIGQARRWNGTSGSER